MQNGACAMGRARYKGRNRTGGVASGTGFYLPVGGRRLRARFFWVTFWGGAPGRSESEMYLIVSASTQNLVTQTHLATRGYGKAHKENLCHMIPF